MSSPSVSEETTRHKGSKRDKRSETQEDESHDAPMPTNDDQDESKPLIGSTNSQADIPDVSTLFKMFKTGFIVFTWIFIGIFTAIIGATLIDLTEIARCSYTQIGQALTGLHLAMPVGSISAGILCGRFPGHLDLFLAIFLASLALSSAALPWCNQLWLMASVMVVQGMSRSVLTCCGNVMMLLLWKEKSPAPLHAMHFGTGFGSFIAPLMAGPFLSPQQHRPSQNTSVDTTFQTKELLLSNQTGNGTMDTSSHIYIPYGIEGVYGLICSSIFLLFFIRLRRKGQPLQMNSLSDTSIQSSSNNDSGKTILQIISPGQCAGGNFAFGLQMTILLFFFYCCVIGVIVTYSTYILPVAIDGHTKFTKSEATYLTSAYWGSFAAGRLTSSFIAKVLPIRVMFLSEIVLTVSSSAVLAFYGLSTKVTLWVSTCVFAFVSAPLFPSGVIWTNLYLDVNGPLMSVIQSGVGIGAFVAGIYGGYGLEHYGPNFPLYLNFSFSVGIVIFYTVLQALASHHGPKTWNK